MNIRPVTGQTYRQAAQVLGRAFMADPVSLAVYQKFTPERMLKALVNDFHAELKICIRRGYPILACDGDSIGGVAVIYPPGGYPLPTIDQWRLLIQSVIENGFYNIRGWMSWLDEVERYHPSEPHFYLEYIGVEPENQGQGVGSKLLQHLVAKADEAQVGCYLENSNPRNLPFYERFGFQAGEQKEIIGLPAWLMWRPAAKTPAESA
jgi:ribosomal protein S18 acetylase RimI-like enzyme